MKVAIVHDWLTGMRGGERCLKLFLELYPEADLFTLLWVPGSTCPEIDRALHKTSFIQKIPGARKIYRLLLPLYPLAVSRFDFSEYDLIISLSHAAAKNIKKGKNSLHICYCFTPMRYIWDQAEQYFGRATTLLRPMIKALQEWDKAGASGVDHFVAISNFVAARIRLFYHRKSTVIHPAIDNQWYQAKKRRDEYCAGEAFLYAGALVPYKQPRLVVEACNKLKLPLWIVGTGPEEAALRRMAGPNVQFFGRLSDPELREVFRASRALIFPGIEDFGLVPIECLASGRPVIAQYGGALKQSLVGVKPWLKELKKDKIAANQFAGVFFRKPETDALNALCQGIHYFIEHEEEFTAEACRQNAQKFSEERFVKEWRELMQEIGGVEIGGIQVIGGNALGNFTTEDTEVHRVGN